MVSRCERRAEAEVVYDELLRRNAVRTYERGRNRRIQETV
jgi:hypothetical protein